jgi:hypothetical protein
MRFDVYGRFTLIIERTGSGWLVLEQGADGKRRVSEDVVLPPDLPEAEIPGQLDALLHELARPAARITRLE